MLLLGTRGLVVLGDVAECTPHGMFDLAHIVPFDHDLSFHILFFKYSDPMVNVVFPLNVFGPSDQIQWI